MHGARAHVCLGRAERLPASDATGRITPRTSHLTLHTSPFTGRIESANFQGSVIATLPFADSEGSPVALHASGRSDGKEGGKSAVFLAGGTDKGFVKAWDVSRREARQWAAGRKLGDVAASKISRIAIASDGSRMAATLDVQVCVSE